MKDLNEIRECRGQRFLFKVENSRNYKDYRKYERLRMKIWGDPSDKLPSERNMLNENYIDKGSALFIAVYVQEDSGSFPEDWAHFVGFSYGFVGVWDKEKGFSRQDNLRFYSQYTAVKEEYRKYGLGIAIKEFQKKVLSDLFRVYEAICTFDPLTGVNAYRNIHYFGMNILEYEESLYSDFFGHLNREDVPCDRFLASWNLLEDIQRSKFDVNELLESGCSVIESRAIKVQGRTGPVLMDSVKNLDLDKNSEQFLVEIPYNFYWMLEETHVEERTVKRIPIEWRLATRKAFQVLFKRRYRVKDFYTVVRADRKRSFYVLSL